MRYFTLSPQYGAPYQPDSCRLSVMAPFSIGNLPTIDLLQHIAVSVSKAWETASRVFGMGEILTAVISHDDLIEQARNVRGRTFLMLRSSRARG